MKIIIYGASNCSHCNVLKNKLKRASIEFESEFNMDTIMTVAEKAGLQSMPIVEIDGEFFDDGGALKELSTKGILV